MAKAKMDEQGRIQFQIPLSARKKLGLKSGSEFEVKQDDGVFVLKPVSQKRRRVKSPPLSATELAEIGESEREIAEGKAQVYANVEDFLNDLHAERERAQAAKKKAK